MGFSGLRPFGPTLVHHVNLKVRSDTHVHDFMVVDSPGMIDSSVPISHQHHPYQHTNSSTSSWSSSNDAFQASRGYSQPHHPHNSIYSPSSIGGNSMDRGYDFEAVVKWFAERADLILLFFDPDKPV